MSDNKTTQDFLNLLRALKLVIDFNQVRPSTGNTINCFCCYLNDAQRKEIETLLTNYFGELPSATQDNTEGFGQLGKELSRLFAPEKFDISYQVFSKEWKILQHKVNVTTFDSSVISMNIDVSKSETFKPLFV